MSRGQDDGPLVFAAVGRTHAVHLVALNEQGIHATVEMHLAAARDNLLAHPLDDARQTIGANMGMGIAEDVAGRSVLAKDAEDAVHVAALLRPRIEFAVGESPCAAFAEGVVALAVHHVFARNAGDVLTAFVDILAALEHDGAPAVLNQAQGSKQSARACADHNGCAAVRHVGIGDRREIQFGRLFAHIYIERQVNEYRALPCVNAAAAYAHLGHIGCAQVQLLGHVALEGLRIVGHLGLDAQVEGM